METRLEQTDLFPSVKTPEGTCVVNDRCLLRYQDDHCLVLVAGHVVAQYAVDDQMACPSRKLRPRYATRIYSEG